MNPIFKTMIKACKDLDIHCVERVQGKTKFLLIDDKVFMPDAVFSYPVWRDIIHRAYLKDIGLNEHKYYQNMFKRLSE